MVTFKHTCPLVLVSNVGFQYLVFLHSSCLYLTRRPFFVLHSMLLYGSRILCRVISCFSLFAGVCICFKRLLLKYLQEHPEGREQMNVEITVTMETNPSVAYVQGQVLSIGLTVVLVLDHIKLQWNHSSESHFRLYYYTIFCGKIPIFQLLSSSPSSLPPLPVGGGEYLMHTAITLG